MLLYWCVFVYLYICSGNPFIDGLHTIGRMVKLAPTELREISLQTTANILDIPVSIEKSRTHSAWKFPFPRPGKWKKAWESEMLIGTSRQKSAISLLLVVVLWGYQIYQFPTGLRFILRLNSLYKGIKLYIHEVPDIDIAVCNVEFIQIFFNPN